VTARHTFEIAEQKVVESLTRELVVDFVIAGRGAFGSFFGHNRGPYNCGIRQLCYITSTEAACVAFGAIRQRSAPTLSESRSSEKFSNGAWNLAYRDFDLKNSGLAGSTCAAIDTGYRRVRHA
jgi:hypothetical protein